MRASTPEAGTVMTARLDLIPMTPDFLRASLRGDSTAAAECIGLALPDTWPDIDGILAMRLSQLQADQALQPWLLRAIGLRDTREMIGHIGFHDAPGASYLEPWSAGGVELGFAIFAPHRRRGYAREAAVALMQWAREIHLVRSFVVTISPSNRASLALAASLGFVRVGAHEDEIDGPEDIFILGGA